MTELWYTEKQTDDLKISFKITDVLHSEQSDFQKIDVVKTNQYGNVLLIDGLVMTTDIDEFVYHEMIVHVAMNTHPNPQKILVVGGGDGGSIREIIKHPTVKKAVLAEIDGRVVEVSKKYFPNISSGFADSRVEVRIIDGIKHVTENKNEYDVIIIDSTDPIGPAVGLFTKEFYQSIHDALKDDGIMVAQTESPFINKELINRIYKDVSSIYPIAKLFLADIPTYPSGLWSFTLGSKKYDPTEVEIPAKELNGKYYTPEIHKAAFTLPKFVADILK